MAEILTLREIFKKEGAPFIRSLFSDFVIISEKLNATRFCFERTDTGLIFYKKDGKITSIDRTMSSLYEDPINYIESLSDDILNRLPIGFIYGLRYFYTNTPANISYDRLPMNGLILTDIKNTKGKIIDDPSILNGISDLLMVEKPPIIWYGKLDESQKTRLLEYLRSSEDELERKFKTGSFTKYIISILNPEMKTTALNSDIEKPIDSVIFKFISGEKKETFHAKLIDPIITQINRLTDKEREPQDMYGIILSDVIEFVKINGLRKYAISKGTYDDRLLELSCLIFNDYMSQMGYRYKGVELDPLSFIDIPKFDLNSEFITDIKTRDWLKKSETAKQIFKIIMGSFSRPKKKPTGTLTQFLLDDLHTLVKKIKEKVEATPEIKESSFPTFEEYIINKTESSWTIKE